MIVGVSGGGRKASAHSGGRWSTSAQPAQADGSPWRRRDRHQRRPADHCREGAQGQAEDTDAQLCSRVTYRNTGSDEEFFNVLDWKIQSPDGVQQLATYALDKGLSAGQLAPGGTVSGDVCRQGPGAKGEYVVSLDRTFLDPIRWKATI